MAGSSLNMETAFHEFAGQVRKLIGFDQLMISTIDWTEETLTRAYISGLDVLGHELKSVAPLSTTSAAISAYEDRSVTLNVADPLDVIDRFLDIMAPWKAGLRSFIMVPLHSQDRVIGIMQIASTSSDGYSSRDLQIAERIGNQIAGAVSNSQLFQLTSHHAHEEAIFAEIGRIVSSSLDIEEIYDRFAAKLSELIPFDGLIVNLAEGEEGKDAAPRRSG